MTAVSKRLYVCVDACVDEEASRDKYVLAVSQLLPPLPACSLFVLVALTVASVGKKGVKI